MTYNMTEDEIYIPYIQSLQTTDTHIPSAPWDLWCLECPKNHQAGKQDASINFCRFGVFMMVIVQTLAEAKQLPIDIYLQTDVDNHSFVHFLMLGFCYSWHNFGPDNIDKGSLPEHFPFCRNPQSELPKAMYRLAHVGELPYITNNEDIRMLVLHESLRTIFPPKILFTDHDVSRDWLYKVPLPPPTKFVSWAGRTKEKRHVSPKTYIGQLKRLIPPQCLDTRHSPQHDDQQSGIHVLFSSMYFRSGM